ncbi:hypothetical protein [Paraburkholderia atlantica]|uniref:hypothetical protein n=1 Tax=Paraburkholderia atlantica TaxID=2654982 RepID=UPI003D1D25F0
MRNEPTSAMIDAGIRAFKGACGGFASLGEKLRIAYRAMRAADVTEPAYSWLPIATAPRNGKNILIRFGSDGVSQAKYVPGTPYPWKFIDTNDGITWLVNHAVDTEYGPTHWMPLPSAHQPEPGVRNA